MARLTTWPRPFLDSPFLLLNLTHTPASPLNLSIPPLRPFTVLATSAVLLPTSATATETTSRSNNAENELYRLKGLLSQQWPHHLWVRDGPICQRRLERSNDVEPKSMPVTRALGEGIVTAPISAAGSVVDMNKTIFEDMLFKAPPSILESVCITPFKLRYVPLLSTISQASYYSRDLKSLRIPHHPKRSKWPPVCTHIRNKWHSQFATKSSLSLPTTSQPLPLPFLIPSSAPTANDLFSAGGGGGAIISGGASPFFRPLNSWRWTLKWQRKTKGCGRGQRGRKRGNRFRPQAHLRHELRSQPQLGPHGIGM